MNNCTFIGRIGRDAEVKYSQAGKPITVWALAIDDGFGEHKTTTWLDCAMFGERGPKIAEYIRKGDKLGVSGSIRMETFTKQDGTEKSKVALRVQEVALLGEKRQDAPQPAQRREPAKPAPKFDDGFTDDLEDVPF